MWQQTQVVLVRHGETAGNYGGIDRPMSGWSDVPLTAHGHRQARALSARLADEARPSAIYSSPLKRTLQTAEPISERLGIPICPRTALREIGCGEVDGLPLREVQERYPCAWADNARQQDPDFAWPGGESYRSFRERILDGVRGIVKKHAGARVLLVTHAGVINQILGWVWGHSAARWEAFRPRNASVTELAWIDEQVSVLRFDEVVADAAAEAL